MCFFSSPKVPDAQPIPTPAPTPTVMPSSVSPQTNEENKRKRLEQLRYGFASTLKTGGRGISGTGAELSSSNSKQLSNKLG